jgi:hypothetical protein
MKYFSSRICNFYMQKLSPADAAAAAKKLLKKLRNFVKLTFFNYNIKKTKKNFLESQFLVPKF